MEWPGWWHWELDISSHVRKRMLDRDFTEVELRAMMEDATGFHPDFEDGRWVIEVQRYGNPWEVIVEPAPRTSRLVVITAYPLEDRYE
jgi:hypothetical protein